MVGGLRGVGGVEGKLAECGGSRGRSSRKLQVSINSQSWEICKELNERYIVLNVTLCHETRQESTMDQVLNLMFVFVEINWTHMLVPVGGGGQAPHWHPARAGPENRTRAPPPEVLRPGSAGRRPPQLDCRTHAHRHSSLTWTLYKISLKNGGRTDAWPWSRGFIPRDSCRNSRSLMGRLARWCAAPG